jgi:hypothetical protein
MKNDGSRALDLVAAAGLALGGIFGIAGTLVGSAPVRQTLWAIDGIGIVVATALLAVRFVRNGDDCVAAGFIVFVVAESLLLSGTPAGLVGSVPSFGAGVALWATSLLMTSIPRVFPLWVRLVGSLAALAFAITAARIFWGEQLLPTAAPLPSLGYPFLVLTFAGWAWRLLKGSQSQAG